MGFLCGFLLVSFPLAVGQRTSPQFDAVHQASLIAAKLTTRTERSIAYLCVAQGYNRLGRSKEAMAALDQGWNAWKTGSDKGLSEGDAFDSFTLFDESDSSMLPVNYAAEFLYSGSLAKAEKAADALGDSPLAKSYRHGLGMKIRDRFPEAFELLAFTKTDREARIKRKNSLVSRTEKIKEVAEPSERAYLYFEFANELMNLGGKSEALDTLKQAEELIPQVEDLFLRVPLIAQIADSYRNLGMRPKGLELLQEAIELDKTITGDPTKVLRTHFSVEQTKRSFGLPHSFDKVIDEMNKLNGVIPREQAPNAPNPGGGQALYMVIAEAQRLFDSGDKKGASVILRKITPASMKQEDTNGWWHVLAGELQTAVGDKSPAAGNLAEGSRRFVSQLRSADGLPTEELNQLERIAVGQRRLGNKEEAAKTLKLGVQKLVAGPEVKKMMHMGDGGNHMVSHDRVSPILHKGAISLSKIGDFTGAGLMARSIKNNAHRAVTLAGIVRDENLLSKT